MISKFTSFTEDNYVKDTCMTVGTLNTVITIYRAKCMKDIPDALKEYVSSRIQGSRNCGRGRKRYRNGASWGAWNAIFIEDISFDKRGLPSSARVYVTAILRRPWTSQQNQYYAGIQRLPSKDIVFHPWDSESCPISDKK